MNLDKYRNNIKSCKRLLESDTLGSFDFFTSTICLDSVETRHFEAFKTSNSYAESTKVFPLAIHEYTHFVDSTSTLWGMKHHLKMNEAYSSSYIKGGSEDGFFKAKDFFEHVRSLRLPTYYTEQNSDVDSSRPWQSQITIGIQFDLDGRLSEKPILFSNFRNLNGELLARSPISVVSLLEASAMSNEMMARMSLINGLGNDEKSIEIKLFERDSFDYIYNQNLTEYSVCVHIVANILECEDLFVAFQICSTITRIVLNFPDSLIDVLMSHSDLHEILDIPKGHEFEKRFYKGIYHHDLGILYFLICKALPKDTHKSQARVISGIESALEKLNLSFDLIQQEAHKQISEIHNVLKDSQIEAIKLLANSGENNFKKIDIKSSSINFSNDFQNS